VRGYSKDRIRRKKIEEFYNTNSFANLNYNYESDRSIINSPYLRDLDFQFNKTFNNNNNNYSNTSPDFYKEENKTYSNINSNSNYNSNNSVHYRLNSQSIGSKRRHSEIELLPSKEMKEKKDIEECSFQPKINNFNPEKFNPLKDFSEEKHRNIKDNNNSNSNNYNNLIII
jgi:hypothetical protein